MSGRRGAARGAEPTDPDSPEEVSESERELFGGQLVYDTSWAQHESDRYQLNLRAMLRALPRLVGGAVGLAWRADRAATTRVAVAELLRGVCQALGLLGVNWLLTRLLAGGEITDRLRDALPVAVLLGLVAGLGAVCGALSTLAAGPLEPKVERVARERYLERAYQVEMAAMEDDDFHRLLESAQYGASSARRMIPHSVAVVGSLLSLVAAGAVLTALHPVLLPMLVAIVLPRAWATLSVSRRRYRSFHRWVQHSRGAAMLSRLMTDTDAAPEIRVHGIGPYILRHFRGMSVSQEAEQARLARLAARTELLAAVCTGLFTLATYLLLAGLLWSGVMALAAAGTAVLAIRTGTGNLDGLVRQLNYLHEESLYVGDLDRLLAESEDRRIPRGGRRLPDPVRCVEFDRVSFAYPGGDGEPVLREVSLRLPTDRGAVVALVGENGSGKSTLAKLLCGLYLPDGGTIRWDGVEVTELDRQEIFDYCAIVHQDHYRWPMTARVNTTISRTDRPVDERRLAGAAAHAGIERLVAELPKGWATLLSRTFRGGHQLSGGQWQRIGIARAHYRDAPLLVVDEPTAALDAKAEARVFDQIRALADRGQTIVLITHRMASVRHADQVHVLHQGRLVESGSPEELLADEDGHYRALHDLQAAQFRPVPAPRPADGGPTAGDEAAAPVDSGRQESGGGGELTGAGAG
ncbi:ABC transporter ATP-binding protein [Streptomyces sp. DSM 44915]|uniref:ABC transporter ATP-binding protein n=1 Tax=Streptomyces chisholmiae TaxID=3075540 RepID=A0ABU2JUM4_9ACTN|nr:ABC transporter ATP-binding protein [Streptomyces sp. DSM 44915]MDT0268461.1 ABC transporter ATP-binding protein [Streptomyces sp. DSM 44915]